MAIAGAHLGSGGSTANQSTPYTTASFSPAATTEIILGVVSMQGSNVVADPVLSGLGMTWSVLRELEWNNDVATAWLVLGEGTPDASGTISIDPDDADAATGALWAFWEFEGVDTAAPIVQHVADDNGEVAATTYDASLAAFADATNNATFVAVVKNGTAAATEEASNGYAAAQTANHATPNTSITSSWKTGEDTTPSMTGSSVLHVVFAAEIAVASGGDPEILGDGALTIRLSAAGEAAAAVQGDGAGTIRLSAAGDGAVTIEGDGAGTIRLSAAGDGSVTIEADGAGTIQLSAAADGSVLVQGDATGTVQLSAAGDGSVANPGVNGDGALTIQLSAAGEAGVLVQGTGAATIQIGIAGGGEYPTVVAQDGPIAWWRFEETGSPSSIEDYGSGTPAPMTPQNADDIVYEETGIAGGLAVRLRSEVGDDGYFSIGSVPAKLQLSSYTLETWVKLQAGETDPGIVVSERTGDGDVRYLLGFNGLKPIFGQYVFFNTEETITAPDDLPLDDEYHHIVGTHSGSAMQLWVDGVMVVEDTSVSAVPSGTGILQIGRRWDNASTEYFRGWVDEVAFYDGVLADARIIAHHDAGVGDGSNVDVLVSGDGAGIIQLSAAGDGFVDIAGDGAATIALLAAAEGAVLIQGDGTGTIQLTAAGEGSQATPATGALTIQLSAAGDGSVAIQGDGALAIALAIAGEAVVTNPNVAGFVVGRGQMSVPRVGKNRRRRM